MQPAQHLRLVVGLAHGDVEAERHAVADAPVDKVGVRGDSVDVDLAGTQPTEVGTVEHVDLHGTSGAISAKAARSSSSSGESRMDGAASPSRTTNRSRPPRAFLSTRIAER